MSEKRFIPKEQLTAFQRYEMAAFDSDATKAQAPKVSAEEVARLEKLAAEMDRARNEGREAGYAEGFSQGAREGAAQAKSLIEAQAKRMENVLNAFTNELINADNDVSLALLSLSLDIAQAMVKSSLSANRELILPIVRDSIHHITEAAKATLILHPEDAQLIEDLIGDQLKGGGWKIQHDPEIEIGGCRITTALQLLDSTLPTRWAQITASLGEVRPWSRNDQT